MGIVHDDRFETGISGHWYAVTPGQSMPKLGSHIVHQGREGIVTAVNAERKNFHLEQFE